MRPYYKSLMQSICDEHEITLLQLLSHRRTRVYVMARIECAKKLRNLALSYPEIGHLMNRDHSSILHMLGKTKKSKAVKHRQGTQNG